MIDPQLVAVWVVGRQILLQWRGTTPIEQVYADTLVTASVCGGECSSEVWCQVDPIEITCAWCEDTWNRNERSWVGSVVPDDGSVYDKRED